MIKSVLTSFIILCAGTVLGQTTVLKYKGGTYSFGEQYGTGTYATVKIRPINAEKALFCIDVEQGEPSYDIGSISGVIKMKGTVGVYEKKDNDVTDIKLQFVFKTDQLTVSTLDGRNAYGYSFGFDGMHPNYVYKFANNRIPEDFVSDQAESLPFIEAYLSMIDPDYYYNFRSNELWSSGGVKSGSTIAGNQKWYKNDSLNQVTMATDYGAGAYSVWMHFYKDQIPDDLLDQMKLLQGDGLPASLEQKKKDFSGFVEVASDVDNSSPEFFESVQGVKLGDPKAKAITMYGQPDEVKIVGGYERLTWIFMGESEFDPEVNAEDTKLVRNCAGFSVKQYYKDSKLVAQLLEESK